MRTFCFTVDLDRDVNCEVPGQNAAGSLDRGAGNAPRFASTAKGLILLADLLDDLRIPATFFCEGRTLEELRDTAGSLTHFELGIHGYDHERLSGRPPAEIAAILKRACEAVVDVAGRRPDCFRAPFMKPPRDLDRILPPLGIRCDSSSYAAAAECIPSLLPGYIAEIPVTEGTDAAGKKIAGYLWPMHEGKRVPQDYADLAVQVPEKGAFVLADHTWHLVEGRAAGVLAADALKQNLDNTRQTLELVLDAGCSPRDLRTAARLAS
mgnify:CR=1 FL=1